jgi:hypothetical protein
MISFIVGPGPRYPDGCIIKEYVKEHQPRVIARGYVTMFEQLRDGVAFLLHIFGYEQLGEGEFMCVVHMSDPFCARIKEGIMLTLDGVYNGFMLEDIHCIGVDPCYETTNLLIK